MVARLNSAYHHDMLFKRHISIKNNQWQKLFIWQSDPFGERKDNKKAYQNKMTLLGVVFYIGWFLTLVFSVIFLMWGTTATIEPLEFGEDLICTTLNKAVVLMVNLTFDAWGFSFYCLNIVRCRDVQKNKFVTALWWLVIITMFIISIAAVAETIKLFS